MQFESFEIDVRDKPNLYRAMIENPELAREVIRTFTQLMDESFDPTKGVQWAEMPKLLNSQLTFQSLIRGTLRGALDLRDMNPDAFDAVREEVHPLSMLTPRKDWLQGGTRTWNWRNHFKLPDDVRISEETVAQIVRKTLYYSKYIDVEKYQKAIEANQIATFRGIDQVPLLPMVPALRYQTKQFGELHMGIFLDDIGALDCGVLAEATTICPACNLPHLKEVANHYVCMGCNAGYKKGGN